MTAPRQTPGGQREDTALAAGAAVGAIMAALQAALIALIAVSIGKVLAGGSPRLLERAVHLQATALVNRAVGQAETELARYGEEITTETTEALQTAAGRPVTAPVRRPTVLRPVPPPNTPRPPGDSSEPAPEPVIPGPRRSSETLTVPPGLHQPAAPNRALSSVADNIRRAGLNALRDTDDLFRQAAERATANHATGTQAAQKMLDDLAEHGLTAFTDERGREWDLAAYSEMATRTAATRLSLLTQLQLMGPAGMDLVVVDAPSGEPGCRRCAPYEGRVLSLSGRHTVGELVSVLDGHGQQQRANVVSSLADAVAHGLLHPNCRHYLAPFVDGAAMLPLVGSQRGFVQHGQPVYRPVPAQHDSASYAAQQKQRALERAVRAAGARQSVALTPLARSRARTELGVARKQLAAHVEANGLTRQRYREHPTKAR